MDKLMHYECRVDIYCLEPEYKLGVWRHAF